MLVTELEALLVNRELSAEHAFCMKAEKEMGELHLSLPPVTAQSLGGHNSVSSQLPIPTDYEQI